MATTENNALFIAISEEDSATVSGGLSLDDLNKIVNTVVPVGNGQGIYTKSINTRQVLGQLAQQSNMTEDQYLKNLEATFKAQLGS